MASLSPSPVSPPSAVAPFGPTGKAIAGLVLGVLALAAWLVPIAGLPVAIAGLVFGILGRRSSRKGYAVAGIVMSAVGLVLSLALVYVNLMARAASTLPTPSSPTESGYASDE